MGFRGVRYVGQVVLMAMVGLLVAMGGLGVASLVMVAGVGLQVTVGVVGFGDSVSERLAKVCCRDSRLVKRGGLGAGLRV